MHRHTWISADVPHRPVHTSDQGSLSLIATCPRIRFLCVPFWPSRRPFSSWWHIASSKIFHLYVRFVSMFAPPRLTLTRVSSIHHSFIMWPFSLRYIVSVHLQSLKEIQPPYHSLLFEGPLISKKKTVPSSLYRMCSSTVWNLSSNTLHAKTNYVAGNVIVLFLDVQELIPTISIQPPFGQRLRFSQHSVASRRDVNARKQTDLVSREKRVMEGSWCYRCVL